MVKRRRYTVVENTPGYLPDSEPAVFTTKRAAQQYARDLARELRELGYRVYGNMREGYYAERPDNEYDLGRVISITEVYDYDDGDETADDY